MSAVPSKKTYAAEEYLALERQATDGKCELVDGQIYAMVGASRAHNLISINIAGELRNQLKHRPCEAYVNDMKVKLEDAKNYYYPDIVVVCGKPEFADAETDILLNPTVLIEVLSPSTEAYDRGGKFARYRHIPSLREYLLVSQDQPFIEHYVRQQEAWVLTDSEGLDAVVDMEAIGCKLALREVYDRVLTGQAHE